MPKSLSYYISASLDKLRKLAAPECTVIPPSNSSYCAKTRSQWVAPTVWGFSVTAPRSFSASLHSEVVLVIYRRTFDEQEVKQRRPFVDDDGRLKVSFSLLY